MQGADLGAGLARRVVLEDGAAGGDRMDMGNAMGDGAGRGLDGQAVQGVPGLGSEVADGRGGREYCDCGRAGQAGDVARGVDVEEAGPAGQKHEIRSPGGREGCGLGMGAVSMKTTVAPASRTAARAFSSCGAWAEETAGHSVSRSCAQVHALACGSRWMTAGRSPVSAAAQARFRASVVLPAPPFWAMRAMMRMVCVYMGTQASASS